MGNCSSTTEAASLPSPVVVKFIKDVSVHGGGAETPRESIKGILLKDGQQKLRTLSRVSWKDFGALEGDALPGLDDDSTAGPAAKLAALAQPQHEEVAATLAMLKVSAADGSGKASAQRASLDDDSVAAGASTRAADAALTALSVGASVLSQRAAAARQELQEFEASAARAAAVAATGGSVAGAGSGVRRAVAEELAAQLEAVAAGAADAGRPREALALCLHAHTLQAFAQGPFSPESAHCLVRVARVLKLIGHLPQAELLAKYAAHQTAEGFGLQHRAPGEALMLCGELLGLQGRFEEARAHLKCALELHVSAVGRQSAETADVFMQLGELHARRELYDEAARLFRQAHKTRKRALGPRHAATAAALEALAGVMYDSKQHVQAEQTYCQLLQLYGEMYGSGVAGPGVVAALGRLAAVQAAEGRSWEAETTLRRAQAAAAKLYGSDHPVTLGINLDLARLLLRRKDASEVQLRAAEQLLRASLRPAGRSTGGAGAGGGAPGVKPIGAMAAKAAHGVGAHKYGSGSPAAAVVAVVTVGTVGAGAAAAAATPAGGGVEEGLSTVAADAQVLLAELVGRRGRLEEAERLYTSALDTYTRLHGTEHPVTARCMCALAGAMAQRGRGAAGEPLARRALAAALAAHGDAHPAVAACWVALGDNLVARGLRSEAAAAYRSAHAILMLACGPEEDEDGEAQRVAALLAKLEPQAGGGQEGTGGG